MINAYCPRCHLPLSAHERGCPAHEARSLSLNRLAQIGLRHLDRASRAHLTRWGIGGERHVEFDIATGQLTWWFDDARRFRAPAQVVGLYRAAQGVFCWGSTLGFSCAATRVSEQIARLTHCDDWTRLLHQPLPCSHREAQAISAATMVLCRAHGVQEAPATPGTSWYTVFSLRGLG